MLEYPKKFFHSLRNFWKEVKLLLITICEKYDKRGYRGIYRSFPTIPDDKISSDFWMECLRLTETSSIDYRFENFTKLYKLSKLLDKEKNYSEVLLIDRDLATPYISTIFLGYDITNDTTYESVIGDSTDAFFDTLCKNWNLNENKLLPDAATADSLVEYVNQNIHLFEDSDGLYRKVSVECVV